MKLSFKTILPIILISALLILLSGCMGTVPTDESPGYTPGTITGIIAAPCCSTSDDPVTETCCVPPEYWCYYCQGNWLLQDGIEVVLTYGEDEVATTTTNDKGEFTFTNVDPGKNYVVTAYCSDFKDNRPLVKDVALQLVEGGSFDTNITDLVSTSLGLVVDFLVLYTDWGPEDISLDAVLADRPLFLNFPKFKALIHEVRRVLENCEINLLTDDQVQYATCKAAEEISALEIGCGAGFTPPGPPPPPPTGQYNLYLIADPWDGAKTLTGAGVYNEGTQNVAVNTEADACYEFLYWTVDVGNSSWVTGDLGTEPLEVDMNGNVTLTAHFACPVVDPDLVIIISESLKARTLDTSRLRNGRQAEPEVICYPNCAKIESVTVNCECTEGIVFLEPPYDSSVLNIVDRNDTGEIDIDYSTGEICFIGDSANLPKTYTIDVTYTNPCGAEVATGTVTIEFKDCTYTLTMAVSPSDGGTTDPIIGPHPGYAANAEQAIIATPATGFHFVEWTVSNGAAVAAPGSASTTVVVDADKTVTAVFERDVTYTLTMAVSPSDGGTTDPIIGPHPGYAANAEQAIIATPATGFHFVEWTVSNGAAVAAPGSASTTVVVDANKTVTAVFEKLPCVYLSYTGDVKCHDWIFVKIEDAINLHKAEITLQYTNAPYVYPNGSSIGVIMDPGVCNYTFIDNSGDTRSIKVVVTRNSDLEAFGDGTIAGVIFGATSSSKTSTVTIVGSTLYDKDNNVINHTVGTPSLLGLPGPGGWN